MKSAEFKTLSERAPEFRDRVAKLSSVLQESMAPFDAFDVLANIWFSNYVTFPVENEEADPETYAVIEYAGQLLAKRNRREGKELGRRFIPGPLVEEWTKQLLDIVQCEAFLWLASASLESPEFQAAWHVVNYDIFMRHGGGFLHQEEAFLVKLLEDPGLREHFQSTHGFDPENVVQVIRSLRELLEEKWQSCRDDSRDLHARYLGSTDPEALFKEIDAEFPGAAEALGDATAERLPEILQAIAIQKAWTNIGDRTQIHPSELSKRAHVKEAEIKTLLDYFALPFGYEREPALRSGANPVRRSPFIRDADSNYFCLSIDHWLWAIRPGVEESVKQTQKIFDLYQTRRGALLEKTAFLGLKRATRPTKGWLNAFYQVGKKRLEADCLIQIDSALIVVQAKSAPLRQTGEEDHALIVKDLTKLVGDAAQQAGQLTDLLSGSSPIEITDNQGTPLGSIVPAEITRVFPLAVTLTNLNSVSSEVGDLLTVGAIPKNTKAPLIFNIHDLTTICDIAEHPAQLIHYLSRRSSINDDGQVSAKDELDLFGTYLDQGLLFDHILTADDKRPAIKLGDGAEGIEAYYTALINNHGRTARKPRQEMGPEMRSLLTALDNRRPKGFLEASLLLLDLGGEAREQLESAFRRLAIATGDNKLHDVTMTTPDSGITLMAGPRKRLSELDDKLNFLCQLHKYEEKAQRWLGLGILVDVPAPPHVYMYSCAAWQQDDRLENALKAWQATKNAQPQK